LLVAHGDLIHSQTILLLPLLPVDAGHEGGGEDEADDAEQGQHHATPDVGQQQRLNITIQPTLHNCETTVDVDLAIGELISEDVNIIGATTWRLHQAAGVRNTSILSVHPDVLVHSVPVLKTSLQVESSTTLEVSLESVPLVPDVLINPVVPHLLVHLRRLRVEHDLSLHLVPQLHADEDGGELDDDHDGHEDGVDDESDPGLEASSSHAQHGEEEEEETNGEDQIWHRGEVSIDQVKVGEEIDVDEDAGEVQTGCAGDQHEQVDDTQHCGVLAHGVHWCSTIFDCLMSQRIFDCHSTTLLLVSPVNSNCC